MRRLGWLCLLLVGLVPPGFAQPAGFPMKRWFMVETLNGTEVRDRALTFMADVVPSDGTLVQTANGFAGCNIWNARYDIAEPDAFKLVGGIATTKMMCPQDNVMLIEASFLAALGKIARWRMEGVTLVLTGDQTALRLSPQTQR
jgi:heat shock protein HslJ